MITGTDPRVVLIDGATTLVLDNIISVPDWNDVDQVIHKALSGDRYVTDKGVYVNFDIEMNLWKAGDLAARKAKMEAIYAFRFIDFNLKPHYDGNVIKNSNNVDVLFHFTGMQILEKMNQNSDEILKMSIMGLGYYDLTKSLVTP